MGSWVNTRRIHMYLSLCGKAVKMPCYRRSVLSVKSLTPFKKMCLKSITSNALLLRSPTFVLCIHPLSKILPNLAPSVKMRIGMQLHKGKTPPRVFSRSLNYTNCTKSRKASHLLLNLTRYFPWVQYDMHDTLQRRI